MPSDLSTFRAVVRASGMAARDKEALIRYIELSDRRARSMTFADLKEAREFAGLSVGQAARLLDVPRAILRDIERGRPPAWWRGLWDKMDVVYGLAGGKAEG